MASTSVKRAYFDSAPTETLRAEQFVVTTASDREVIFTEEKRPQSKPPSAWSELRLLGSRFVIRADVAVQETPPDAEARKDRSGRAIAPKTAAADWRLEIELFHVDVGEAGSTVTADRLRCDTSAAGHALSERLRARSSRKRPASRIAFWSNRNRLVHWCLSTEPSWASRRLRPSLQRQTSLEAAQRRLPSDQRDIEVPESQRLSLKITLAEGTDPAELPTLSDQKSPIYKKWWFWAAGEPPRRWQEQRRQASGDGPRPKKRHASDESLCF